jgi:hypothetical protein
LREEDNDANISLWFHGRFSIIKILEWHERKNEEEDYFFENDLGTVMAL